MTTAKGYRTKTEFSAWPSVLREMVAVLTAFLAGPTSVNEEELGCLFGLLDVAKDVNVSGEDDMDGRDDDENPKLFNAKVTGKLS